MEELQMRPEDPLKHSPLTLECRCNNVRVKLEPLSSLQFHHCQAIVIIFTYQQALDLQRDDPSSRLTRDRLTIKRSKTHKYWVISVIVDHRYQTFTQAIQRSLQISEEKRLSTLAISVMTEPGDPRLKEQATLIRNCVDCTRDIRYLQILKIMMTNRDDFDKILTETIHRQEQERQSFHHKVSDWCNISKAQWKCVKNSENLNSPRLYLTIVGEDEKNINTLFQKLIKEISILKVKI
ncbi:uncharacterized protein [Mytilus edulis]|uniref:uncharacterized protein n=1 Tax=Mytilus edulis TaxID=6550 RepID=UPI0039EFDDCF